MNNTVENDFLNFPR